MATCKSVFYEQGPEGCEVMFQLVCENVPLQTMVSLSSDNPNGANPPINIPPTPVFSYPTFIVGFVSNIAANYTANLTYCFTLPAGVQPPPGFSITLQALIAVNNAKAKQPEHYRIVNLGKLTS